MLGVRTPTARSWEMSVTRANLRAAASRTRERDYEARKLQDFSLEQVQAFRTAFDHIGSRFKASTGWLQEAMKSINVSLSSQQLRDILHVVTNEAIPGKGMEFEEFVFLSLFLARYFQKINVALEEVRDFKKYASSTKPTDIKLDKPLKMPHVIRHYAAGIKMEGASETKMAREIIRLRQTSVENSKSPYAELLVLNYFNRFISHKKAGMAMESSAENCRIMTKFHALQNSTLPQIDAKHPNRGLHVRYDTDVKKPRPKTSSACTSMIAKNNEELPVESKRPHRCKAKIIDVSNASPMIVKQRLQCTVKDYRFYPKGS